MLPRHFTAKLVGANSTVRGCHPSTGCWADVHDDPRPGRIPTVNRQHTMFTQASVSLDGSVI